ncbi:hypothetical protein KI387_027914, partial [Taxus chinensis]
MSSAVHLSVVENLMSNGFNHLQVKEKHIFPPHQRHQMYEVSRSYNILVVDLKDLDGPNRNKVVSQIKSACEDGFFQGGCREVCHGDKSV